MATAKLVLFSLLSLIALAAGARRFEIGAQTQAQQCQLQRITTSRPSHKIESEGGITEVWDPSEDEFQCAGAAAYRDTIQPNSMTIPKFFPAPRLVYIVRGRGVVGVNLPGCAQTFQPEQQSRGGGRPSRAGVRQDPHQRVHRVRRGDVIAIPHGAVDWCYNDGNEELIAVTVVHLNNRHNQLDQLLRAFLLGGGQSQRRRERESSRERPESFRGQSVRAQKAQSIRESFQNIFRSLDEQVLAESFNVNTEIVRRLKEGNNRGTIIKCEREMRSIIPDERAEEEEEEQDFRRGSQWAVTNVVEETVCTLKTVHGLHTSKEPDFYTEEAGRIHIANENKFPILNLLEMSAERGVIMPRAMHTPNWAMRSHRIAYVLRGEMHIQIVDDSGDTVMDERVKEGDMFVIPQFYAVVGRAGNNIFEYITFKTDSRPMKHPMAGSTSVMRAMPLDVLVNAYDMSPNEADQVKRNRDPQSMLLSPLRRS